jgi:hypothetical protein
MRSLTGQPFRPFESLLDNVIMHISTFLDAYAQP